MKIYALITFEYDTYSYSGHSEAERFHFTTRTAAETRATELKLTISNDYITDPNKECFIDEIEIEE